MSTRDYPGCYFYVQKKGRDYEKRRFCRPGHQRRAGGQELQKQITDLQAENKAAKEKYEADMKELKLTTAIKLAIGDSAHDADLVSGLVDKSKLLLGDDGKDTGL